ncbi:MAG: hypothetical protein JWP76_5587 [Dactylosporangium sp.]|nr:hypothetical protein [Dactylosporangium sp.]
MTYGSTLTTKSRVSIARESRSALGTDEAGLPATVTRARTCPSPGVSISSARVTAGNSPRTSGRSRTRLRQRPVVNPVPVPRPRRLWAGSGNIAPPSRSRLPVRTLRTSTSQLVTVPYATVVVPIRPYTAARSADASSAASSRIVVASTPQRGATASGVNGVTNASSSWRPVT